MGQEKYKYGFDKVVCHPETLQLPYNRKKPTLVFVNSMSDLFHKDVPFDFIKKVFKVMNENPQHTFQVLTKRADQLFALKDEFTWSDNIWIGVTVENSDVVDRIDYLKEVPAKTKWLSVGPLIGPLPNLNLDGIDWVVVGGESGNKARPVEKEWVEDILAQCREYDIPFFFKQWGGRNKKATGRLLNGVTYDEMPECYNQK